MSEEIAVDVQAKELYKRALLAVNRRQEDVRHKGRFEVGDLFDISTGIVKNLKKSGQLNSYAIYYYDKNDISISHAVNVAIFTVTLASGMKQSFDELIILASIGLLHDVGIGKISQNLLNKDRSSILPGDKSLMETHPRLGQEAILESDPSMEKIATVAFHHHELMNGNGYPQHLSDGEIDIHARMLSMVDTYESLIHPRDHRDALIPPKGARELINQRGRSFDPYLLKMLIEHISIYPIGCYVELNSGTVGKVIQTSKHNPVRPVVQLLYDLKGNTIKSQLINLVENPLLSIRNCVPPPEWKQIV